MAYIGRDIDKISNVEVLDNITFDGSSSYTLQKGGSNFTPSSANTLLVSIDGVVQAGNFTVSGSTINFGTAVSASSTCNFILHYGVGLITAPADGTVTTAKLADSSVSLAKLTATGTKDATTFLRGDNTFASAGGANTPAFEVGLTTTQTSLANGVWTKVLYDAEVFDTNNCFASNKFTPTVAGKYFVYAQASFYTGSNNDIREVILGFYKNGSIYQPTSLSYRTNALASYPNYTFTEINPLVSTIIDMNGSSDFLEVYALAYITSTCSLYQQKTFFGGYKLIE
jgi:hypothetical protein